MSSTEWQARYQGALMNTFGAPKLVLTRGSGAHVWDEDGKEYVDLLGGIAVNSLGHAHPAVVAAVTHQLQTLGHVSNFFATEPQIELAERLIRLTAGRVASASERIETTPPARVFFSNSGAEANEAALKLTRLHPSGGPGRTHLVATEGAFHGRTMGALSLTAKEAYRAPFAPLPGEVTFVPYGDAEALAAAVTDQTAAVVLEPIQGEAGVVVPPEGYLAEARKITREHGALLWLDEIQSGIGRTGTWLRAAAEPDVAPDIVTLAKGLAGGIPIGATIAIGAAASLFGPGNHGTTFGGNPIACAAALAVLDTIESEDLLAHVVETGHKLADGLAADPRVSEVRGAGLFLGVELIGLSAPAVVTAAQAAGFILNAPTPTALRLVPPLVITSDDVEAFLTAWPAILDAAREAQP